MPPSEPSRAEALFTGVRRREILRSSDAGCRIAPLASHPIVGLILLGSARSTTIMLHLRIMMRSGGCAIFLQNTDTDAGVGVIRC
jgi:hypothetical protein